MKLKQKQKEENTAPWSQKNNQHMGEEIASWGK